MLLYSFVLAVAAVVSAPWWLLRMATTGRYREGFAQRLGRVPLALRTFAADHKILWLHAVSVGEVLAATRLVAELEAALGTDWRVVISTTTATGQALARQRFAVGAEGGSRVFHLPLDFAFAVRAFMRALQPQALVLMESELWPRLLHECSSRNVPVIVANARVSDRSFARTQRFARLWQRMARHVTLFLAQSEQDAQRLARLGARNVQSVGNLKYDVRAPQQSRIAELIKTVAAGRPVIVAGSTTAYDDEDEELSLATAFGGKPKNTFNALLVLAPRHPQRFEDAWQAVIKFHTIRATTLLAGDQSHTTHDAFSIHESTPADIILLDTIGDLASVYSVADIAFIGGSLLPNGGHNPLEAAQFGVPVVMGNSYENFSSIVEKLRNSDAVRIVSDDTQLADAFIDLLANPAAAKVMGERGRQVFDSQQGATARSVAAILEVLSR